MKKAILLTTIATFLAGNAQADGPLMIRSTDASITLTITDSSDNALGEGVVRYLKDAGTGVFEFDSNQAETEWQWIARNTASPAARITAMRLQQTGTLGLVNSATGAEGLIFSAVNRSINFGSATDSLILSRDGTTLKIGSSKVLTESLGDARYLRLTSSWGQGTDSLAYGTGSWASGNNSIALGKAVWAMGEGSVAMGVSASTESGVLIPYTLASTGKGSVSMGYGTSSQGDGSIALGWASLATGKGSVVLGHSSRADQLVDEVVAIGAGNNVKKRGGTAIGGWNTVDAEWGTALGAGNVVMSPAVGTPAKYQLAAGYQNTVWGEGSVALGYQNTVHPNASFASALGIGNDIYRGASLAAGFDNALYGTSSVAIGSHNAIGTVQYDGQASTALGDRNTILGDYSLAVGRWNEIAPAGYGATAIGVGNKATGTSQFVVGSYNLGIPDATATVRSDTDAAFVIGNGYRTTTVIADENNPPPTPPTALNINDYGNPNVTSYAYRRNALVVRWNGDVEASGQVQASGSGGVYVPGTMKAYSGKVLVKEAGDIDMGEFVEGEEPQ